jgi:hypothetical protein
MAVTGSDGAAQIDLLRPFESEDMEMSPANPLNENVPDNGRRTLNESLSCCHYELFGQRQILMLVFPISAFSGKRVNGNSRASKLSLFSAI